MPDMSHAFYATGRRKEAIARVWLSPGSGTSTINERALEDYYGSRGYVHTRAKASLTPDAKTATVDLRFDVKEGPLTRIGTVEIRGNTRTRGQLLFCGFSKPARAQPLLPRGRHPGAAQHL